MDYAQRGITVLYRIHDNTHGKQIVNLVNGLILVLHFLVNTKKMLDTAIYLRFDARAFDMLADLVNDSLNISLPLAFSDGNLIHQIIIGFRLQIF